jgi:hypothetical protein
MVLLQALIFGGHDSAQKLLDRNEIVGRITVFFNPSL